VSNNGNSVVDYCIVSQDLLPMCESFSVDDCILSPHMYLTLRIRTVMNQNFFHVDSGLVRTEKIIWDGRMTELYLSNLRADLSSSHLSDDIEQGGFVISNAIDTLSYCIVQAADCMKKTFVYRKSKDRRKPWFDKNCFSARKMVRILLRRYRMSRTLMNRVEYSRCRKLYKELIRERKCEYRYEMTVSLSSNVQNPELFWKQVRMLCCNYKSIPNISLQAWFEHFENVFSASQVSSANYEMDGTHSPFRGTMDDGILNAPFDSEEIVRAISSLKARKSPGIDNIFGEMLKCSSDIILPYLQSVFNEIFMSGEFPVAWAESIVVPIHKGDVSDPNNYRGISFTSVLSKVYVHVLGSTLKYWAEENELIREEQAGFRNGYSTVDNVFVLHGIIQRYLHRRKKLYVAYVDFRKAFDTVNREVLWTILEKNGIRGHMITILKSMYSSVRCRVRCAEGLTDSIECQMGLKQGCKASPGLFLYMVNEIAKEMNVCGRHGVQLMPDLTNVFMLLFADDIALISDTVPGLQNQLNVLKRVSDNLG